MRKITARAPQDAPCAIPAEAVARPVIKPSAITNEPTALMLAYADKVRQLNGPDLTAEINRLGDPGEAPAAQLQLAIALSHTRASVDLARAAALGQRVASNLSPDAQPLQPLARLLVSRYLEQRRIEDERDRLAQQLRDSQKHIEQLNDRIEALRAIERSFMRSSATTPVPATAAPAPGNVMPAPSNASQRPQP